MHTSIEGVLAEHAVQEAKRQRFLETAAAIVAAAPPSLDDTLLGLLLPFPKAQGPRAFLNRVDQVLRHAAR
ncbi:hypothetical protein ADK67_07660 [Saccharothrix sp. NRRL B-16348]|jgi:hypothetical protein|uniref:hypothetical protein n=1 Tax=Saccharothrix sp. NRRL B-16348 TaxID=1415542 RepID=UPI0006ADF1A1|nr:hypothetical protein [Saccharothrix sp. NRRL B-16348]KOX32538.1 hypothetical protein ADK67_07660 [Saccharothrix sp. NRRL B-16348]